MTIGSASATLLVVILLFVVPAGGNLCAISYDVQAIIIKQIFTIKTTTIKTTTIADPYKDPAGATLLEWRYKSCSFEEPYSSQMGDYCIVDYERVLMMIAYILIILVQFISQGSGEKIPVGHHLAYGGRFCPG